MELSANILSEPLRKTINDSLTMGGIFPDAAKIAAVSPIDKSTENKNRISNFRPVSVLSVFSTLKQSLKISLFCIWKTFFRRFCLLHVKIIARYSAYSAYQTT